MNEAVNFIFELTVNLFQGTVFTLFCNMFFTPRFKRGINALGCSVTIILLFFTITIINYRFSTYDEIEILAYLLIIIPFTVFFHKGKLFLKIVMPVIIFVVYMCVAMGYTSTISSVFNRNIEQIIMDSSAYRYIYIIITNLSYIFILYIIVRVYKNKIDLTNPIDIITCFAIPALTMITAIICTYIITDPKTPEFNRICLGIITFIAFIIAFAMFPLMKQISKAAEVRALNILMAKEQEMYKTEITNQNTYIEEVSHVKHEMKRKLFCISELLAEGNISEAQHICAISEQELRDITPTFRTDNLYLNAILNTTLKKAKEYNVSTQLTIKSDLIGVDGSDLLSLAGNIIDNAFEALQKVKSDKLLQITIFEKEHYYIVSVRNTVPKPVLEENPDLKTTKSETKSHGHGLNIVKSIVKKYKGTITFNDRNETFDVSFMLEKN